MRYENGKPVEIVKILISTQHKPDVDSETLIKPDLWEHVVEPVLHADYRELYTEKALRENLLVNPTGKFEIGGPMGDAGLTGRKIIVDTYGGAARHGGGAFSGKDPSKVDRSAAYAARYVAKNVVAAGLADRCEVQVAYAIGVAHPLSLMVETYGTERVPRSQDRRAGRQALRPAPRSDHPRPRPAPADLPQDRRLRPLRPRRPRLHVGEDRQGRRAARGRRHRREGRSRQLLAAARALGVPQAGRDVARDVVLGCSASAARFDQRDRAVSTSRRRGARLRTGQPSAAARRWRRGASMPRPHDVGGAIESARRSAADRRRECRPEPTAWLVDAEP